MRTTSEITRRKLLAGAASLGLFHGHKAIARKQTANRPNILFIMADDMGYADLGCYGSHHIRTPNLDRLAANGIRMLQGYANSAVCSATRTALITGRYQYRLPCGLEEPIAFGHIGLPLDVPTLPGLLRQLGYQTALIGKWHLGAMPDFSPLDRGYDSFFGVPDGGSDYFTHRLGPTGNLYEGERPVERAGYMTDLLGERAVADIKKMASDGRPFFMSLHFTAPHWPWEGPEDAAVAKSLSSPMHWDGGSLKTYAAMVECMDANVGRIIEQIERLGIADDTIVVFTSDNGGERFSETWPFTGAKTELLEGGLRVPLIVKWPARIKAGTTSQQVMISMDFVPTLLSAAGADMHNLPPFDGQDLLGVLVGIDANRDRTLYWRYKAAEQAAVRQGEWKYLKIRDREFLFNLTQDERERANLKDIEPGRFASLKQAFAEWDGTMLPYLSSTGSHGISSDWPDHYQPVDPIPNPVARQ
ncbi:MULTISPECIES: sulfatase family protein [Sphingobium]|uniref:Twin-arginine translocation pathway signal protein n=1 Tax=Sphingobium cupriresistens LL01 TaxID=1420583 RepID=A0A0J7Y340_9SPHN|nr:MULTISPECIES: sulfatase-like hydrolase/transferase [Sphingobium]KMS58224.1 twin-arginine translocation pathway signal protein [Sphingobium cupriresistens LL01]MBJ7375697.1 sulfatase-like hydrolase/transferase [Sphingobium sp.]